MRHAAFLCLVFVAAVGCGGGDPSGQPGGHPDCAYPLAWDGGRYDIGSELPETMRLGAGLRRGVVLGCGNEQTGRVPDEAVTVRRIEGFDPDIAVAARLADSPRPYVWLAPGFLIASPRHPFHAAGVEDWVPDLEGFTCGEPLMTNARALETPGLGQPLRIEAEEPVVEALLVAPGTDRLVSLLADTAISGLERHGVPYVEEGDEFVLMVRACDGDEDEPGLAGLRLLVADRLAGRS